ncbi:MAG: T9SS type A sorting domain-containing protein, partial [Bacteroidota bacterium]|nr:T9SS type A sorting domain-containing protein [Bacteroidota bacterium]
NNLTWNGVGNKPTIGTFNDYSSGVPNAGIYDKTPVHGFAYNMTLNADGYGTPFAGQPFYTINCGGPCGASGIINGPAATGFDATYGVIFKAATTLPVQLVQFTASKINDGSVLLNWATSQEVNAGYYDVERSSDQSGWLKIGSVKAKGNSSTTTNYIYTDRLPFDGPGYYRLKMVDLDAKYTYSRIVSTTAADDNSLPLVVYSNPFSDQIRLKVNVARAQNLTMTVSDIVGKTFISKSYQAQAGNNYVNLQPNTGGSGIYILHINGDSYNQTVKLEKQ